jgi:hypothetical protein
MDQPNRLQLTDKVKAWLDAEGYPVEFRTAAEFREAQFETLQGLYVGEPGTDLREVDVLARVSLTHENVFFFAEFIVECKWSKDKPWVIFTSNEAVMGPSASIAQAVTSDLGRAALYCLAGSADLCALSLFATSGRGGFGGRQALSQKQDKDIFYSTVQSIVAKTLAAVKLFDRGRQRMSMPRTGAIAFPVIVLEGELFEAYYA